MVHIDKSPFNNNNLSPFLECKDHTVSDEMFTILIDKQAELLVTSPRPNSNDLNKYYESNQYISHSDAKQSLMDKVYQLVKNYTIKQKVRLINSLETNQNSILDIGCGTGDFLVACKKNGWKIDGIEPNNRARKISLKKLNFDKRNNNSIILYIDPIELLNKNKKYDIITMWHVLEHVPNLNDYISNLKKLLKPKGILIIAVPNYKSYDANYYGKFWAAYDVPRHLWHFSKKSIKLFFERENMEIVKILPMKFDSYYVSMLSEKYKNDRSNFVNALRIGFLSNFKARNDFEYSSLIYLIKNR